MYWVPDGNGRRCPQHDKRFALGEPCPDCVLALVPAVDVLEAAPTGDEADEDELELREFAKGCRLSCIEMLKLAAPNPAAKFGDLYIKTKRLIDEMKQRRVAIEQDEREMEHEREMTKGH